MGDRLQADYWIDFGDESSPRSLKDRARWHEARRQRVIASILLELHLMAATEIIPRNLKTFSLVKARWQDDFGSSDKDTQAAHCAPRQLIIRAKEPHLILRRYSQDRADYLQGFFAKTSNLPANFNKADSRCERNGLVQCFRLACQSAISSGQSASNLKINNVSVAVKKAFEHYKINARSVFQSSVDRLNQKLTFPKPLPDNERKWREQLVITEYYAHELRYSTAITTITRLGEIEDIINTYRKI